ncbi:Rieske (2Fe-2S) protein [Parasphingorhabdus sp.]|uniref:Rieske (2Fe-2S) protein n=1 Tax=Parasphingorhabdus sp. TaxID=2709688 RepID=UPI003A8E4250
MNKLPPPALSTPAGIPLCSVDDIPDNGGKNFRLKVDDTRFCGFVLRRGDVIRGYVDRCPHAGGQLARKIDNSVSPDGMFVSCSWHGAMFRLDDGVCVDGPCVGESLLPWPIVITDGQLITAETGEE